MKTIHFLILTLFLVQSCTNDLTAADGRKPKERDEKQAPASSSDPGQQPEESGHGPQTKGKNNPKKLPVKKLTGAELLQFYDTNYSSISADAKLFWAGAYGCAAYASTALLQAGYDVQQTTVTTDLEAMLQKLGWTTGMPMNKLLPGDVVFTDKATSNLAGTWSHVFVYRSSDARGNHIGIDNNGRIASRKGRSRSIIAYRAP